MKAKWLVQDTSYWRSSHYGYVQMRRVLVVVLVGLYIALVVALAWFAGQLLAAILRALAAL